MFIAALFTIARTWRRPRCALTDERIKNMWCNGILLSHKKDGVSSSEVDAHRVSYTEWSKSEREKQISYTNAYRYNLKKWWKVKVLVIQLCPTLCGLMGYSLPGCSVHGILQARILEWAAIPFSRGSSQPRDGIWVSCMAGRFFTIWVSREEFSLSLHTDEPICRAVIETQT